MKTLLMARGELFAWIMSRRIRKTGLSNLIINCLMVVILMGIAIYLFARVGSEFMSYAGVLEGLLSLYLFILFLLCSLLAASGLRHSLFESHMSRVPLVWPVSKVQIIVAKTLVSLAKTLPLTFLCTYPIWITYAVVASSPWWVLIAALFYPILISVAEVATGFLLCVPMQAIHILIRKSIVVQIIFGVVCAFAVAFLYGELLNLFTRVIVNGDLNGVLEIYNLRINGGIGQYLFPSSCLVWIMTPPVAESMAWWTNLVQAAIFIGLVAGLALVGSLVAWTSYFRMVSRGRAEESKLVWKMPRDRRKALLAKEFSLLFKGKAGASGIITLFVGLPIVCFFIVTAMNYVFSIGNLRYVPVYFPMFLAGFTGMLILMCTGAICTSSMDTMRQEGKRLTLMKLCPVSIREQLAVKAVVPLFLGVISFVCSMIILGASGLVEWTDFAWILVEGLVFMFGAVLFELVVDARAKVSGKGHESLWESLVPILVPVVIYALVIIVSAFIPRLDSAVLHNICHLVIFLLFSALSVLSFLLFWKRGESIVQNTPEKEI